MICSHCGLEYPDHLAECPNCHTPNDDIAAEVLTEDERDAFEGVTIDQVPDSDTYRVMDQDDLKQAQEEAKPFRLRVLNFLLGHLGLVAVGIIVFLVLLIPVFLSVLCQMLGCPTTKSPFRNSARHLPSSFFANSHRESGS